MIKKLVANIKNKDLLAVVVIIFLNTLPRLIFIFNNSFFIDGDEAIFGTMIRDCINNGHLPLFFYGQNYGFVFFEVLLSSIISFFFGINIFSMKIAMLLFWLMSMVILYYVGRKILTSRRLALLSVFLISATPAWFDWAMKARGGYLSALLLSNLIIFLTFCKKKPTRIIIISLSLILIYYAQSLWLVILLPFIFYYLIKDYKLKNLVLFATSSFFFWLASYFLLLIAGFNYQAQNKLGFGQITNNIENIFKYYYFAYSGRFFDVSVFKINFLSALDSSIFIVILVLTLAYNIYLILSKKIAKNNLVFFSSVVLYIFFMVFYNEVEFSYRYLLPIFIPIIFLVILTIKELAAPRIKKVLYIFLTIYAAFSLICGTFYNNYIFQPINDGYSETERIKSLEGFLQDNNIKCVYALDWIINQHINYFIPRVSVRHQDIDPRRPQDSITVDSFSKYENTCALVGLWYQLPLFTSLYKLNDIIVINKRYIVTLHPERKELLKLEFKLTN